MSTKLLTRSEFREQVFKRDKNRCVFCGKGPKDGVKIDAHHIMDRKLWPDGGYYLDNGATLCDQGLEGCHFKAEECIYSVEDVRYAARITRICLPPGCDVEIRYDKWGNGLLS